MIAPWLARKLREWSIRLEPQEMRVPGTSLARVYENFILTVSHDRTQKHSVLITIQTNSAGFVECFTADGEERRKKLSPGERYTLRWRA